MSKTFAKVQIIYYLTIYYLQFINNLIILRFHYSIFSFCAPHGEMSFRTEGVFFFLLVSDGIDWVHIGCFAGRDVAE